MSLKFVRFELIKISVVSFRIGVNIKLEKGKAISQSLTNTEAEKLLDTSITKPAFEFVN